MAKNIAVTKPHRSDASRMRQLRLVRNSSVEHSRNPANTAAPIKYSTQANADQKNSKLPHAVCLSGDRLEGHVRRRIKYKSAATPHAEHQMMRTAVLTIVQTSLLPLDVHLLVCSKRPKATPPTTRIMAFHIPRQVVP